MNLLGMCVLPSLITPGTASRLRVQISKLIVQKYPCMGDKNIFLTPQVPGYVSLYSLN